MLDITAHFRQRVLERDVTVDIIARALAGREVFYDGCWWHYDRRTRWAVIASEDAKAAVTLYRMSKRDVKRKLSR